MDPATIVSIVGLIAVAFKTGWGVLQDIREKRRERLNEESAKSETLETSLHTSQALIKREYDQDYRAMGQVFAKGDSTLLLEKRHSSS
jgi:F0F1-type ATP synthase membrane subunit b/b'